LKFQAVVQIMANSFRGYFLAHPVGAVHWAPGVDCMCSDICTIYGRSKTCRHMAWQYLIIL